MTYIDSFADELEKIANAFRAAARLGAKAVKKTPAAVAKSVKESVKGAGKTIRDLGSPIKSTKRALRQEFKSVKKHGVKGLNLGHVATIGGAAVTAPSVVKKEDPSGKGRSRIRRAVTWAADQAGGAVGARHGLVGSIVGGEIGKAVGRIGQKKTGE